MKVSVSKEYDEHKGKILYYFSNFDYYDGIEIIADIFCKEFHMTRGKKLDGIWVYYIKLNDDHSEYHLRWHEDYGNCIFSESEGEQPDFELESKLAVVLEKLNNKIEKFFEEKKNTFNMEYKIVKFSGEDFAGQSGFLKFTCNGHSYGDIYEDSVEGICVLDLIFDWMENFVRVLEELRERDYVALFDRETYGTWIEFKKEEADLLISVVYNKKWSGASNIEYYLPNREVESWSDQRISYSAFYNEVVKKANEYFTYVFSHNPDRKKFQEIRKRLEKLDFIEL